MTDQPAPVRLRLLHVPGCPHLDRLRTMLDGCLRQLGTVAVIEEVAGAYPSPTLLVNGLDVITGQPSGVGACCRLDLPTSDQIINQLRRGSRP